MMSRNTHAHTNITCWPVVGHAKLNQRNSTKMSENVGFAPIKLDEDGIENPQEEGKARRRRQICLAVTVVVVIVLIIVAFVVGYVARRVPKPDCKTNEKDHEEQRNGDEELESLYKKAIEGVSKERLEESLK